MSKDITLPDAKDLSLVEGSQEDKLWRRLVKKLKRAAVKAGKDCLDMVLAMFFALIDDQTPAWAKTVIISALGYFIMPIDAIPDFLPGGFTDDISTLATALTTVHAHVNDDHKIKAIALRDRFLNAK